MKNQTVSFNLLQFNGTTRLTLDQQPKQAEIKGLAVVPRKVGCINNSFELIPLFNRSSLSSIASNSGSQLSLLSVAMKGSGKQVFNPIFILLFKFSKRGNSFIPCPFIKIDSPPTPTCSSNRMEYDDCLLLRFFNRNSTRGRKDRVRHQWIPNDKKGFQRRRFAIFGGVSIFEMLLIFLILSP